MTEQQIQRVLGELIAKWQQRASSERLDEQASANAAEQGAYWSGRSDATMDAATDLEEVAEALAAQGPEGCLFPDCGAMRVGDCGRCTPAQVPDISARVRELADECADSGCIHLNDMYGKLRALLDRPNGGE